jgi:aerobic-type carbon monoxide dehydrogenase small subunit (CoxS/CutS family)
VFELQVNGGAHAVDPPVGQTLAETLRGDLGLLGTKVACGEGHCGACTVLLDGVPALSCITLVHTVAGREVTTIEGLREHPLVDAFVRADAMQCGFCTPGFVMTTAALLAENPTPDEDEIRDALSGNVCRCTGYQSIIDGVRRAADELAVRRPQVWGR